MKKRYFYTALFFEITACIGSWLIQYFTSKKMGMLRWVNHLCNTWSKSVDLDRMNLMLMLLVSVLALVLLVLTVKKARESICNFEPLMAASFVAVGIYLVWTIRYTRRMMAAYYLVSPILLLGATIALICWALAVLKRK